MRSNSRDTLMSKGILKLWEKKKEELRFVFTKFLNVSHDQKQKHLVTWINNVSVGLWRGVLVVFWELQLAAKVVCLKKDIPSKCWGGKTDHLSRYKCPDVINNKAQASERSERRFVRGGLSSTAHRRTAPDRGVKMLLVCKQKHGFICLCQREKKT